MLTKELSVLLQSSCVRREDFNLICLTFNVNAKVEEGFDSLLGEVLRSNAETLPDILVIGLQEVVPLNAQNILGANIFAESEEVIDRWMWLVLTALSRLEGIYDQENGTVNPYELLIKEHMVGIWICVISSKSLRPAIKGLQKAQVPRGVGGMFGNKGACMVRFDVHDSSICIVNAHFAAHRSHVQQRNNDFHAILHKPVFADPFLAVCASHPSSAVLGASADMSALQQSLRTLREKTELEELQYQQCSLASAPAALDTADGSTWPARRSSTLQAWEDEDDDGESVTTTRTTIRNSDLDVAGGGGGGGGGGRASMDSAPSSSSAARSKSHSAPSQPPAPPQRIPQMPPSAILDEELKLSPNDHDIIIWLGDLNYRIDNSVPDEYVFQLIESDRIGELSELDQLNIEKDKGSVFEGFHEGILHFPPTYKFIRGTDTYDQRPDKKVRCPSWCDRVLWRTTASLEQEQRDTERAAAIAAAGGDPREGSVALTSSAARPGSGYPMPYENVELMCYSQGHSSISDHKPVFASLNVKVKRIDWAESEQLILDVMEEMSNHDGDLREALTRSGGSPLLVEPGSINLHSLPPVGDNVHLKLSNRLDCAIRFNVKESSLPSWLFLDPKSSILSPGQSINLSATVNHIEASEAYGDDVCKADAALDCPGARHLLEPSLRPEITGLVVLQLKALKENPTHVGTEPWKELETEYIDGGRLKDALVPVVCFLGSA